MGSTQRSGMPLTSRPATTAVHVNLDALFPTTADRRTAASDAGGGDGLVLSGWTAGALHRWLRSSTGQWIGVCTVVIARADGGTYRAVDQLVPAEALRQRRA